MGPAAEAAAYALAAAMAAAALAWAWLVRSMLETRARTPRLEEFSGAGGPRPRVSVIVPARNEEGRVGRCLDSLAAQDYADLEVVAVDDSSEDGTAAEIASRAGGRVVHVSARPKPAGWVGKNWACMEGYARAGGGLLLFTDADTVHAPCAVSLAVSHMGALGLDAVTVIPRMACTEFWTRAALPPVSAFLHTRFSALRVNDPSRDTGYFFGSFFVIRRGAYEAIGTHAGVRRELVEDGALGRKLKGSGRRMRMVLGDDFVEAAWARDLGTLMHALRRLVVPLYLKGRGTAAASVAAVASLLLAPFALLALSAPLAPHSAAGQALFAASLAASAGAWAGAAIETRMLRLGARYALAAPVGGLLVVAGFVGGLARARSGAVVTWRGRSYSMADHAQDPECM